MTPNRYAVPLEQLDAQHVQESDLVTAQPEPSHPDAAGWSGPQLHPFGGGGSGDADGD
jgi:hypothetical protein